MGMGYACAACGGELHSVPAGFALCATAWCRRRALLEDGRYYFDPEDSTTVFEREGFRLKLRYLSDQALNQEYAPFYLPRAESESLHLWGQDRDLDRGYAPPRFTVFEMTVVNQSYPKVMVDPAKMVLRTDRGGEYRYWGCAQARCGQQF